jgi:hypothetical protein
MGSLYAFSFLPFPLYSFVRRGQGAGEAGRLRGERIKIKRKNKEKEEEGR